MIIDHIGIVVPNLEEGIRQWTNLFGYSQKSEPVLNLSQKLYVVFLTKKDSLTVKLIMPANDDSPIKGFALKGGGLHHLCFKCDNLEVQIPLLQGNGARLVVPPQPGEAFKKHNIAFLLAQNNLNIELIDTNEKIGWDN
jgi:methylmalonyl-CoA/ethylmalonyl-CoA epimerase